MNEVLELRQRVAELETTDTRRHQAEERENKAKQRLVAELVKLRQRIAELESVSTEHPETAEGIRQLQELNGDIVQSMAEGIVVEDDEGYFTFVNPAAATMLGYSPEELLGQHWAVIVPPDQHPSVQAAGNRRKHGETDRYELELIRKDKARVPVLLSGSPRVKDGRFAGTLSVFTNITELRQVEEELQQSLERLRRTFDEVIHALASAIRVKDPYTASQQRRVTQLAVAIARELGLPEEQIEGIRVAATVYDIGKINVPAEFLIDPDGLTELEYGIIKAHPQVGYEVLKTIDFPWPVAEIVFQHHERMDGSGYPQGLSGEQILLEARILAVADVVVAMASRQPYRSALGIDRALEEILQNRGILYDTKVVDACLMLFTKKGFKLK
jgi:PAS domain S-box-containing protein